MGKAFDGTWTTLASPQRRATLMRRAQLLAAASVAYNLAEGAIAITAGNLAGSSALVGFGLDSLVEVSSGLVILWQFRHPLPESRERAAQRLIALSFFALAAYVTATSVLALVGQVVHRAGGSVEVTTGPDGGAAFTVRLPLRQVVP